MLKLRPRWVIPAVLLALTLINPIYAQPRIPVIFIPGLIGDASTWEPFGNFLEENGWKFGGCPIRLAPGRVGDLCPISTSLSELSEGDFYRVEFTDNQNLTLNEQGEELEDIIDGVLAVNPGKNQVVLVGHSMGGLAARDYLQFRFNDNVLKLITVGTPHLGAELAVICQVFPQLCELIGIQSGSIAVAELRPGSAALDNLNNLMIHPLPSQISYTSIIGTGTPVILFGDDGDGIVSARSQNLENVAGAGLLNHAAVSIPIADRESCDPGFNNRLPNETHTCETTDGGVWTQLLRQFRPFEDLGIDTVGFYDPTAGRFLLNNDHSGGAADIGFRFGPPAAGWEPLAGDWNGDGVDTVGLFDPITAVFFLRNANTPGAADLTFRFGPQNTGWLPVVGDWDGDGMETVGFYDPTAGRFLLNNDHSGGAADIGFRFGPLGAGWEPLAGDWNGS